MPVTIGTRSAFRDVDVAVEYARGVELTHGGRITLRLENTSEQAADYVGDIETPEGVFVVRARIAIKDGAVDIAYEPSAAPDWLKQLCHAMLRGAWRSSGGTRFPRRISRWRDHSGDDDAP